MRIKPKKSLGQNFLTDPNIRKKIIRACSFSSNDVVLEIGSAGGEVAFEAGALADTVYALELDPRFYPLLEERLKGLPNCHIIKGDILKLDLGFLARHVQEGKRVKVVGNIPYYISSPIITHLSKFRNLIHSVFITVQKEFARRLSAPAGGRDYGSFSCFVQYYFIPEIIFEIKRGSFSPSPKVDSSFLKLEVRRQAPVQVDNEDFFFSTIRQAFSQRRKTLRNNLRGLISRQALEEFLARRGMNAATRAEGLNLAGFADLTNLIAAAGQRKK